MLQSEDKPPEKQNFTFDYFKPEVCLKAHSILLYMYCRSITVLQLSAASNVVIITSN